MDGTPGRPRTGLIIANETAGGMPTIPVSELITRCARHLDAVDVHWTRDRGDATRTAGTAATRSAGNGRPDVVVAVGGDGTVREVVEGLVAAGRGGDTPALFIVPAGTGNSNYLAHWGDLPWRDALTAALTGVGSEVRRLDLALLVETGELVLLGACTGLIAEALRFAREVKLTGRERYREALAQAARACVPYPGRVIVDGTVVHTGRTVLANVGGGRHRGGTYQLLPHSVLDDGLLDVCVIGAETDPVDVPALTREAEHIGRPGVVYAQGRRIVVERTDGEPLWFEHDGELLAGVRARFTLDVVPRALPVLCRAVLVGGHRAR